METYYKGTSFLHVRVYLKGKLIHEDGSFRPSPLHNIDDPQAMVSLLDFLMVQYEGTDREYFQKRACLELDAYANESDEAEEIRLMLYDYAIKDDRQALKEGEMTKRYASRIERYIKNA